MKQNIVKQLLAEGYELQDEVSVGAPFDVSKFNRLVLMCRIADLKGTNPVLNLKVQHSLDKIHWRDLSADFHQGIFPQITEPGIYSISITKFLPYIRIFWTMEGTNVKVNFSVDMVAQGRKIGDNWRESGLEDFYMGLQGIGGYYRKLDGNYYFPMADLSALVHPEMFQLVNAYMGGLVGNDNGTWHETTQIDPIDERSVLTFDINYKDLFFCGMVNLKSFDLTQKYLRSLNEKFGYDLYSMVKIKVGQSDGSMILCSCGSVDYKPNWSHIVDRVEILTIDDDSNEQTKEPVILNEGGGKDIGEEAILGRFSCTPVDIGYRHMDNCCRNDSDPEPDLFNTHPGYFYHEHGPSTPPPEGAFWSDNTYKFTHSLINGCAPDPTLNQYNHGYGNTIFSFENELDNNFGGLDPAEFPKCIQYVPPYDKEFFENEENEDAKPAEMGRHLAHHYMQAYFCFSLAVSDAEEGVFHSKYGTPQLTKLPFGMSNFALGILVARGIYEDGGKTEAACLEAIKFQDS